MKILIMVLTLLALAGCSSRTNRETRARRSGDTFEFRDLTLTHAIELVHANTSAKGTHFQFKVKNDREFKQLVLRGARNRTSLLRAIQSETNCEIIEAGHSSLIILPEEEISELPAREVLEWDEDEHLFQVEGIDYFGWLRGLLGGKRDKTQRYSVDDQLHEATVKARYRQDD